MVLPPCRGVCGRVTHRRCAARRAVWRGIQWGIPTACRLDTEGNERDSEFVPDFPTCKTSLGSHRLLSESEDQLRTPERSVRRKALWVCRYTSTRTVNGPSLTLSTVIIAPNRPVWTCAPRARKP